MAEVSTVHAAASPEAVPEAPSHLEVADEDDETHCKWLQTVVFRAWAEIAVTPPLISLDSDSDAAESTSGRATIASAVATATAAATMSGRVHVCLNVYRRSDRHTVEYHNDAPACYITSGTPDAFSD